MSFGHISSLSEHSIFLSPCKYALDLHKCTSILGAKPIDIPLGINYKIQEDVDNLLENPYDV